MREKTWSDEEGLMGGPEAMERLAEACHRRAGGQKVRGQLAAKAESARRVERRRERESRSATTNAERPGAHKSDCDHY
jgi:hypothetical protein